VETEHGLTLKYNLERTIHAYERLREAADQIAVFNRATDHLIRIYRQGGRLYTAGNGGSAADAQHLAAEFIGRLALPRGPLPAESLTVDTSALTAIGNDFGFDEVFARQLEGKATAHDMFLALTTSGRSRNIIRALEKSRELNIPSIVFTGGDGGETRALATYCIIVPADQTSTIQEVHRVLYHTLCGCVELAMTSRLPKVGIR
jgi:D-sedoheptulose 7-phosphate isomerase